MSRLMGRIIKLERRLPTGLDAELAAMSDEELEQRLDAVLRKMSEKDVRVTAREYPDFFTPDVLEKELARWRELQLPPTRQAQIPLTPHISRALTLSLCADCRRAPEPPRNHSAGT